MTNDLIIEGVEYISSKRASEMTGYSQDYVGQLARASKIEGRRVGGLWYVIAGSLLGHKKVAETYIPSLPSQVQSKANSSPDSSIVTFDGKTYVSASRAAKLTTYHQDYIGQLARGGKILSKQVGKRWYVDLNALKEHKREKDLLLGAVQVASVGLDHSKKEGDEQNKVDEVPDVGLHYKYVIDSKPLMPVLREFSEVKKAPSEEVKEEGRTIPIRVVKDSRDLKLSSSGRDINDKVERRIPRISIFLKLFPFFIALIVGVGAFNISVPDLSSSILKDRASISILRNNYSDFSYPFGEFKPYILDIFSKTLTYSRE